MIDIAELSKKSGLASSALRYYEQKGLISSIGRYGLRRVFDSSILERLAFIALAQNAGFSLDEIREMLNVDGIAQIDRKQLINKAADLDSKIKKLTIMRDGLLHVAECPAADHFQCPSFSRLLKISGKRSLRNKQTKNK